MAYIAHKRKHSVSQPRETHEGRSLRLPSTLRSCLVNQPFAASGQHRFPSLVFNGLSGADYFTLSCVKNISPHLAFIPSSCPVRVASIKHRTMDIFWRIETLVVNALGLSCIILERLSKYLHNGQCRQVQRNPSSSNPKVSEQNHMMSGKACLKSAKVSPAKSSAATTLITSSAFDRDGSSKSMLEHPACEIAAYSSPRPSVKGERTNCPNTSTQTPQRSALSSSVKAEPSTDETAPPSKGIVQQAQKHKCFGASGRMTGATTNASSSETPTPYSSYQKYIEEFERHRVILYSLKREYSRAKADYEWSENTLHCLRRQEQHPLRFWRKQKKMAEKSLGKKARKLQSIRILERDMVAKVGPSSSSKAMANSRYRSMSTRRY